jgi:hypothetical protein
MQAIAIGERQFHEGHANDGDVGECATAYVALGTILSRSGNAAEARRDWRRASELIVSRKRGESDWRLLDPDARAAIWMGRSEEARATISRLTLLGYVPLDPWPDPDRPAATENRNTP